MQDRPTSVEILATIGEYLQQDVLPIVDGALRYKTLVAANLLGLLQRELEAGDGPEQREVVALAGLLHGPASPPTADVADLYGRLQARLLSGDRLDAVFLRDTRDVLERGVLDKLAVNKPGYDRYDQAVEIAATTVERG
ncbi:MAG: DUF6285 domain-containing protein [Acidimicrobiales bacterium]